MKMNHRWNHPQKLKMNPSLHPQAWNCAQIERTKTADDIYNSITRNVWIWHATSLTFSALYWQRMSVYDRYSRRVLAKHHHL